MKKSVIIIFICVAVVLTSSCGIRNEKKNTLDIIGFNISDEEEGFIQEYQLSHPEVTINVTDYAQFGKRSDGITRMNANIMAKKCGDIVIANTLIPVDRYIENGLLWNMNEAEGVEEVKAAILPNVVECCEKDGALYSIFPDFSIHCFVGKADTAEKALWNRESLGDVFGRYQSDGINLFDGQSKGIFQDIFVQLLQKDIAGNGKPVNDDLYILLLKNMRKLVEIAEAADTTDVENVLPYRKGEVALSMEMIDSFESYYFLQKGKYDDDIVVLGYPFEEDTFVFDTGIEFSIFNCSDNKELAWEFISYYFSEEYQKFYTYGTKNAFPVNQNALKQMYQNALSDKSADEEGNFTVDKENSYYIGEDKIDIGIPSEEELQPVLDIIYSVNEVRKTDTALMEIVNTHLSKFWDGSNSAETTYNNIKNAVELYVSENE